VKRRVFSETEKKEILAYAARHNDRQAYLKYKVSANTFYLWKKKATQQDGTQGNSTSENTWRQTLDQLEKEMEIVQEEIKLQEALLKRIRSFHQKMEQLYIKSKTVK
jgi:transposase-like protein